MIPVDQSKLERRVVRAAESALAANQYTRPIDVLTGIGWLYPGAEKEWTQGRLDCIEQVIQARLERVEEALMLLQRWATAKGLTPSEAKYVSQTPDRRTLRFSLSGNPSIELAYRTHWVSPEIPEKKRARLVEKADRPPELVVIQPVKPGWTCHRCGGTGDLLMMENPGPACLRCVGLDDLVFLGAGDALLTRRAKAKSARHAVVVRFSRTRKHYERQGLLIESEALAAAEIEIAKERG